jgi:hypothetical protein
MGTSVIVYQIIIAGIMMLVGVMGSLTGIIGEKERNAVARIIFFITLPLLILTTFSNMNLTTTILTNGLWVMLFALLSFVVMFIIGKLTTLIHNTPQNIARVHITHTMFGNIVFLGFPLLIALFAKEKVTVFYAALYYLVSSFVQWTVGVCLLSEVQKGGVYRNLRNLLNPNTIAFVLGIVLMVNEWHMPEIVFSPVEQVGNLTTPLSMLYIGALLSHSKIRGLFRRFDIYLLSINKLLLIPFCMIWLIGFIAGWLHVEIPFIVKAVVVLETGMPCMNMIVIMAKSLGANDKAAAENVFLTTILSLVSLPFLFCLLRLL